MSTKSPKGKEVAKEEAPRKRAVTGGQVIQNWADLGVNDSDQKGYDQAKFEEAYRYVVYEMGSQVAAERQKEKDKRAELDAKLSTKEAIAALERIHKELDVTKQEAEEALLSNDMDVNKALMALVQPPQWMIDLGRKNQSPDSRQLKQSVSGS